jgi:hypothetical protein
MKCPEMLLLPEIGAAAAGELRLDVWFPARPERDGPHHRHVGVDVSWGSLRESAACSAFASSLASPDGGRSVGGIEFNTDVPPDPGSPPGYAVWSGPRDGVTVEEDYARIRVRVVRNTQK